MAARLFLFYGSDSRASQIAIREWEKLFREKYGQATRYIINADELPAEELKKKVASILEGQTLFSVPKLLIVKRLSSHDQGNRSTLSSAFCETIQKYKSAIDETVTLAVWEEKDLKETHPLRRQFEEWQTSKEAKIRLFSVPTDAKVSSRIEEYVTQENGIITKQALVYIQKQYEQLGKRARLLKKLKFADSLLEDERTWWLYNLLDTALLAAAHHPIELSLIQQLQVFDSVAIGAFDVVNAVQKKQWNQARTLLAEGENNREAGFYFSLLAALRWQNQKSFEPIDKQLLQWLSEIELLLKNFPLDPNWLFCLLIDRLDSFSKGEEKRSLLAPRKLWLAHLMRS